MDHFAKCPPAGTESTLQASYGRLVRTGKIDSGRLRSWLSLLLLMFSRLTLDLDRPPGRLEAIEPLPFQISAIERGPLRLPNIEFRAGF
jgi:hypothetical protein